MATGKLEAIMKTPLALIAASTLALTACTQNGIDYENAGENSRTGALVGGLIGAAIGARKADDGKGARGAIIGGAIGAAAGAGIGVLLDQQEDALRSDLGDSDVKIVNTGNELIVTMPQDILFDTNSDTLRADLQGDLRTLAANLQDFPDTTVDVIGHTDNTGTAEFNQALSQRRAQSVTGVLLREGVSTTRLRAIGRGEAEPVDTNLTPEGRAQNRRVDVIIRPMT